MKFLAAAFMISLILLTSATRLQFLGVAKANPTSYTQLFGEVTIELESPQNKTYNVNAISINFTVNTVVNGQPQTSYFIKGQGPITLQATVVSTVMRTGIYGPVGQQENYTYPVWVVQGNSVLTNLEDGVYNLTVQSSGNAAHPIVSANVTFTVDTYKHSATPTFTAAPISSTTTPPSPTFTTSPTQQPTSTEVIPFVDPPDSSRSYIFYSIIIVTGSLAGLLVYLVKHRGRKR